jgi:GxxExxY protein
MEVHSEIGFGFSEIVYKDALEYEFKKNGILFKREVKYKDTIPPINFGDFVVFDTLILEVKAVSDLCNEHFEQTINYLAVSGMEVGVLVNFRKPKLQYKRVILTGR